MVCCPRTQARNLLAFFFSAAAFFAFFSAAMAFFIAAMAFLSFFMLFAMAVRRGRRVCAVR